MCMLKLTSGIEKLNIHFLVLHVYVHVASLRAVWCELQLFIGPSFKLIDHIKVCYQDTY